MLGWYAPVSVPNTYASGPSVDRRFRIGASRPSGLKGMHRFSFVLRGRARDADLAGLPVHQLVLNQQHLAAPAAQLESADDAVVERRSDELMLRSVHLMQRGVEQPLLFLAQ